MVKLELKRKETGTKTIAIATANYDPWRVLYRVKCPCKVSIALLHSLQRYARFSVVHPHKHTFWRHQYLICILEETLTSLGGKKILQKENRHPSPPPPRVLTSSPYSTLLTLSSHISFQHIFFHHGIVLTNLRTWPPTGGREGGGGVKWGKGEERGWHWTVKW